MPNFWSGFEKRGEASKEDLKKVLRKHEERETPEQEAAESKEEQKVEREAGVEKHAISHNWAGKKFISGLGERVGASKKTTNFLLKKMPDMPHRAPPGETRSAIKHLKNPKHGRQWLADKVKEVRRMEARGFSTK